MNSGSTGIGGLNSFFGSFAGQNSTGSANSFFGAQAGQKATGGTNSFFGDSAGRETTGGSNNSFFGEASGVGNTTGSNNTLVGATSNVGLPDLTFATAIGSGAVVTASNRIVLGRSGGADSVDLPGLVIVRSLGVAGPTAVCRNVNLALSTCSSSIRYKQSVRSLTSGFDLVRHLRPVTFNWQSNNQEDMGLVAEEVAEVEPLLATYNEKGEIEGVKYDRVGVVLINAVKEQQARIELQQKQIEALKRLICEIRPQAAICREEEK